MFLVLISLLQLQAYAQYLPNEPAVAPLLEGIRYCAMEPMAGAEDLKGLQWIKEVKSGDSVCAKNAATVQDEKGTWIIYENSSGQIRAVRLQGSNSPSSLDEPTCRLVQGGASGPDFSTRGLAATVASHQKKILLKSESARPNRTTEDRLQFALCHGAMVKLLNENGLAAQLSRAENEKLTRVHRGSTPDPASSGSAGR